MDVLYHSSPGYSDVPAYSQILLRQCVVHLRTVIVTADIDEGLTQWAVRIATHDSQA